MYELKEVQRQKGDDAFIQILNELRTGKMSEGTISALMGRSESLQCPDGILPIRLYPLNDEVERVNLYVCGSALCYVLFVHRYVCVSRAFVQSLNEVRTGKMSEGTISALMGRSESLQCPDGILPTRLYPLNDEVERVNLYVFECGRGQFVVSVCGERQLVFV